MRSVASDQTPTMSSDGSRRARPRLRRAVHEASRRRAGAQSWGSRLPARRREPAQTEPGVFPVGMKSYGRAHLPRPLAIAGYEEVRGTRHGMGAGEPVALHGSGGSGVWGTLLRIDRVGMARDGGRAAQRAHQARAATWLCSPRWHAVARIAPLLFRELDSARTVSPGATGHPGKQHGVGGRHVITLEPGKPTTMAIPYGVYDLANDNGWVSVGVDHDTSVFAVATIEQWWLQMGLQKIPERAAAAHDGSAMPNWASRSGCWAPSVVLALACRLYSS
jgi:Rhodopirellula transposase DDE domain